MYGNATRLDFLRCLSYFMAPTGTVLLAISGLHFSRRGDHGSG